jgi:hypothetical protein
MSGHEISAIYRKRNIALALGVCFMVKPNTNETGAPGSLTKGRVPHTPLVFRDMWDTTDVDR